MKEELPGAALVKEELPGGSCLAVRGELLGDACFALLEGSTPAEDVLRGVLLGETDPLHDLWRTHHAHVSAGAFNACTWEDALCEPLRRTPGEECYSETPALARTCKSPIPFEV